MAPKQFAVGRMNALTSNPRITALHAFQRRLKEDQVFKLAAMLAYYLLLSVVPILVMLLSVFGIALGHLDPHARHDLISAMTARIPGSNQFLPLALEQLRQHSGALAILSVLTSVYFGCRLFKNIDYCFGIILRVPPRSLMPEQFMAIKMLLFFILVVPVLVIISSIPGFVSKQSVVQALLGDSVILALGVAILTILAGWLVASVVFVMTYVVIPNRHVPLRLVWKGALIAGALLEIYHAAFPLYAVRYLDGGNDAVIAGFALMVVVFFYYFGLVLLLGAEINAFFFDRDRPTLGANGSKFQSHESVPLPQERGTS